MPFSPEEKAQILEEFHRNGSVATTQRWVCRILLKTPLPREYILRWQEIFLEVGNLDHRGGNRRPRISNQGVEQVWLLFQVIPVLVFAELQLLYKCMQRKYIEFCVNESSFFRTECKTCISCSRFTSSMYFRLLDSVKITRMATQKSSLEFYLRMNAYFVSMGILKRKTKDLEDRVI